MTATLTGAPARFEKGLRELAPGVHAWLQPNGAWGETNAGLVVGGEEALLVDTLFDERLTREMLAAMEPALGGARITTAVNTHSDGDHWWGNAALPADTEILTSAPSRRAMDHEAGPGELGRMARLTRAGARLPGPLKPLTSYVGGMLAPFDFGGVRLRHPDRAFENETTVEVGGRAVHLKTVGPAHTPGDAIVHVPDAGVVFAADVLFSGSTPVMWFGPLSGWLAALDTLLSLDAATYVPGHGPPGDRTIVEELRDYMTWLGEAATAQHAEGRDAPEATRVLVRSGEFDRWRGWECPERLLISVDTIHRALDGKQPAGVEPLKRARLFSQIGALRRELA